LPEDRRRLSVQPSNPKMVDISNRLIIHAKESVGHVRFASGMIGKLRIRRDTAWFSTSTYISIQR
jgi:hypothetical protein